MIRPGDPGWDVLKLALESDCAVYGVWNEETGQYDHTDANGNKI